MCNRFFESEVKLRLACASDVQYWLFNLNYYWLGLQTVNQTQCNFHLTWYQEERIVIISNVKPFHKTQHISLLHLQKKIWKGHFYWNILFFCIGTIVDISPSYIFTFLSYAMARKGRYRRSDQIRKFTYIIAFLNYWNRREKCKVHIFWEDHKILRNLHLTFVLCSASQK